MKFISIICTAILALLTVSDHAHAEQLKGARPNIILVMTDDQGMGDLSCMGNQLVKTPNIDQFFQQATRFTDFHVSPTCAPTRAAIMSGRSPFHVGVTHTILQRERMALDVLRMLQVLKSAGYTTGLFGKWHLGDEKKYLPQNRGVDVNVLTAHIDLYQTISELVGAKLPDHMQTLDGRSLLRLLENPQADWPDRALFVHCGRWQDGQRDSFKYKKCAVRTERWRLVNHKELYDLSNDPGESKDVATINPKVVDQLRKSYDKWWESAIELMVNEGLPKERPEDQPFAKRYKMQPKEKGIPDWMPAQVY